ncbi:MAG: hypothetical protein HLX50_17745 [Alteromonadaceae bacterium]|nr:hypothetical protein [Alteromonadaceae bacterium]
MREEKLEASELVIAKIIRVFFKEKRLPVSWDKRYHEIIFEKSLQEILRKIAYEMPLKCAIRSQSELHILTCSKDLFMAIAACKSFLLFYNNISIVFHGDESLTYKHADILKKAIKNAKVISYQDAKNRLRSYSRVSMLRDRAADRFELPFGYDRKRRAWAQKIFDFYVFSESKKVIVMDSDVLFVKFPEEIINWIESNSEIAFYSVPQFPNLKVEAEEFDSIFPQIDPLIKFNGGLYGYCKDQLSLEMIEDVVEKLIIRESYPVLGDECFWRAIYSLIPSAPLPFEFYPLITEFYRKEKLMPDMEKAKYFHFILKHRGGIYQKVARDFFVNLESSYKNKVV